MFDTVPGRLNHSLNSIALRLRFRQSLLHEGDALVQENKLILQRCQPVMKRFNARHPLARELNKMLRNSWSIFSRAQRADFARHARSFKGHYAVALISNDR